MEKRLSETVPMSKLHEDQAVLYTTIFVGNPPQPLDVQLDTASSDLWTPISGCTNCNTTLIQTQSDHTSSLFNISSSTTFVPTSRGVKIAYGDGTGVGGVVSKDTVSIGDFVVHNQTLIAVESVQGQFDTAGVFGLGWPTLSTSRGNPWWINAIDQFDEPEFGLYLTSPTNVTIAPAGQLTLGGRNESLLDGEPQFVRLLEQSFWAVPLTQVTVTTNSSSATNTASTSSSSATVSLAGDDAVAILDCGSELIYGPTVYVDAVYASIEGAVKNEADGDDDDGWLLPCDTRASLVFSFGTVDVVLPSSLLVQPSPIAQSPATSTSRTSTSATPSTTARRYCSGTLVGDNDASTTNGASPAWILGHAFLKATYTVFRKGTSPSVGFAKLKSGYSTSSNGGDGIGNAGVGEEVVTASPGLDGAQTLDSGSIMLVPMSEFWVWTLLCTLMLVY